MAAKSKPPKGKRQEGKPRKPKAQERPISSKYLKPVLQRIRNAVGLTQEDLAEKAGLSPSLVGGIERERGTKSLTEESLVKICLGLEAQAGRPMLANLFYELCRSYWEGLVAADRKVRQERGLAPVSHEGDGASQEELECAFDSTLAELKSFGLLAFRVLSSGLLRVDPFPVRPKSPPPEEATTKSGRPRTRGVKRKPPPEGS